MCQSHETRLFHAPRHALFAVAVHLNKRGLAPAEGGWHAGLENRRSNAKGAGSGASGCMSKEPSRCNCSVDSNEPRMWRQQPFLGWLPIPVTKGHASQRPAVPYTCPLRPQSHQLLHATPNS